MSKEVIHNYISNKLTNQPFSCQWIPSSCSIITVGKKGSGSNVKGEFKIHQLDYDSNESPKLSLIYENEFSNPFRCLSFFNNSSSSGSNNDNRKFASGHFNGSISIWDSDICDLPKSVIKTSHSDGIMSIDTYLDNLVVCGGKDGSISVWDTRSSKLIHSFIQEDKSNCWSICTNDSTLISGFENGNLNIYDFKTNMKSKLSSNVAGGICSIASKDKSNILNDFIITTNKSFISIVNSNNNNNNNNSLNFNNIDINNNNTIWSCCYSPFNKENENIFSIAQGDGIVSMYKDQGILVDKSQVSDSPIISLDYSKDKRGLLCSLSLKKQLSILISPI